MADIILKTLAFLLCTASIAVVAIKVPSPDLIAITILVVGMVAYDFFVYPNRTRK
jgi:hypothetical protein